MAAPVAQARATALRLSRPLPTPLSPDAASSRQAWMLIASPSPDIMKVQNVVWMA
jgi:hypothetical protein